MSPIVTIILFLAAIAVIIVGGFVFVLKAGTQRPSLFTIQRKIHRGEYFDISYYRDNTDGFEQVEVKLPGTKKLSLNFVKGELRWYFLGETQIPPKDISAEDRSLAGEILELAKARFQTAEPEK